MVTKRFRAPDGSHMCEIFFCDRKRERHCCAFCPDKKRCGNPCLNNPEKCEKHFIQGEMHDLSQSSRIYPDK